MLAAALLLSACDAAVPAPAPSSTASAVAFVVPKAGDCFEQPMRTTLDAPKQVDCAQEHRSEIAAVGTLTGVSADSPPPPNDPSLATADADCRTRLAAFTGTPLGRHGATLEIGLPTDKDWKQGQRWYSCEAVVVDGSPGTAAFLATKGSLAGGRTPLPARRFALAKLGTTVGMTDAPCTGRARP